jgi:hypothetical protein
MIRVTGKENLGIQSLHFVNVIGAHARDYRKQR